MSADRVEPIDWDGSRGDVPELGPALPGNAAALGELALDVASQASSARVAAVCVGDEYAVRRLAEVRPVGQ